MNLIKFVIAPYFLLGMVMGAAFSKHSSWHPGRNAFLVLGAIHIVLIVSAYSLAMKARSADAGIFTVYWQGCLRLNSAPRLISS
jgi:hypothetical protein